MSNSWSKEEVNKISSALFRKLGPEYISYRQGFGNTRLSYVEGWLIIDLANRLFGFNGWSSEIKNLQVDFSDFNDEKKSWSIGITVHIRITLKDGTFKEDVGFGSSEGVKRKSDGFEKAKKEAVTDGIKRALRQFGNALGNCCYDKEYLKDIIKVSKERKEKMNIKNLLRQANLTNLSPEDSIDLENLDLSEDKNIKRFK